MNSAWFDEFASLIVARTGLSLREEDRRSICKDVELLVTQRVGNNHDEYIALLRRQGMESANEWHILLDLLTINESYFFRDQGQFSLLKNHILPELIAKNRAQRTLRIWSAACATGEEAYSLAIILSQLLLGEVPAWNVKIIASDISALALAKARQGIYSAWSFRQVDPAIREQYFTAKDDEWHIDSWLKTMVDFRYGNLVEDVLPNNLFSNFDLILCRNAFIYFQPETVASVAQKLLSCLRPNAYLMTGHSELGFPKIAGLAARCIGDQVLYQQQATVLRPSPPVIASSPPIYQTIKINSEPVLASKSTPKDFNTCMENASQQANLACYDAAIHACQQAIAINSDSPLPHLILAQIAEVQGRRNESIELLKKALYLDPENITAYVDLIHIYTHDGKEYLAKKMQHNALNLLRQKPAQTLVYHETTAGELLKILESND